ncbi:hypothetical protein [Pseudobdellovibrio exovorus]|uniref:Uncharacterized protein n=1 Tax=Pseudobdellovibrio exovorus JSS TaxID=1184267 RepID=M4V5L6_9BACT|nr:hypothetical protein [Pseudobdellovibrio exovorus]AGH94647.1 hypothetical protein A11Q_427 [Pseudobdellovibrio exovorus JSS]
MKTILSAILTLGLGISASAQYFGIPMKDTDQIESSIQASIQQELSEAGLDGFQLQNFKVDWSPKSFKCLQADASEMNPEMQIGVCVVNVSAVQVEAKAAIARKANGYSVSILYVNVE